MAIITPADQDIVVSDIKSPAGDHNKDSGGRQRRQCNIQVNPEGAYADADGIQFDAAAAILRSTRNGRAIVIRNAMPSHFGLLADNTTVIVADDVVVADPNITFKLDLNDFTTPVPDGAIARASEYPGLLVVYDEL